MPETVKQLKGEISKLQRQLKVQEHEIADLKSVNQDLEKGINQKNKKAVEELQHKVNNLVTANKDYESIIERFSEENGSLRDESLDAQRMHDDVELRRQKFKRRAVGIVRLLDRWLGKLPKAELETFRQSEDYEKYAKFYDRYLSLRKGI
jgi:chromosome segregation ATPase